jgi:hypothetical protein
MKFFSHARGAVVIFNEKTKVITHVPPGLQPLRGSRNSSLRLSSNGCKEPLPSVWSAH